MENWSFYTEHGTRDKGSGDMRVIVYLARTESKQTKDRKDPSALKIFMTSQGKIASGRIVRFPDEKNRGRIHASNTIGRQAVVQSVRINRVRKVPRRPPAPGLRVRWTIIHRHLHPCAERGSSPCPARGQRLD